MLPEDISLVKDDHAAKDTRLQLVFAKNAVLPTKGKVTVEVGKTIVKGAGSDAIQITGRRGAIRSTRLDQQANWAPHYHWRPD